MPFTERALPRIREMQTNVKIQRQIEGIFSSVQRRLKIQMCQEIGGQLIPFPAMVVRFFL